MYPNTFFNLFPAFPRDFKVFVAMSFDPRFDSRWKNVIAPAVRNVQVNEFPLEPYRVDVRRVSDSILTEILEGITNSLLFFADVTTIAHVDEMPFRNANVMYEVGLAHAIRLPEEVILFRSDKDRLLFDVANVRVNDYSPDDDPHAARELVSEIMMEALNEIELKKHLAVKRAAESLDFVSWVMLSEAVSGDGIEPPVAQNMAQFLANAPRQTAIARLLDMGALTTSYLTLTPEAVIALTDKPASSMLKYRITPFGEAVLRYAGDEMGISSPEVRSAMEQLLGEEERKAPH
jgi:hypothetical protein